jgi:hypothetical protein
VGPRGCAGLSFIPRTGCFAINPYPFGVVTNCWQNLQSLAPSPYAKVVKLQKLLSIRCPRIALPEIKCSNVFPTWVWTLPASKKLEALPRD